MPGLSRRTLLKRTSAGAAALGALIAAPQVLGRQQSATASPLERGSAIAAAASPLAAATSTEPLVAYVRNQATGEIAIFSGTREIVLHDSALVSRLLQAGS